MVPEACATKGMPTLKTKEEPVLRKAEDLARRLRALGDPMAQYDYLLTLGMERPVHNEIMADAYRIAGCKTAIWIRVSENAELPSGEGGRACGQVGMPGSEMTGAAKAAEKQERRYFEAESDSLLVRGVLALFEEVYQGVSRREAAECPPVFLSEISEDVIYEDIRKNGLQRCYERIAGLHRKKV
ncbi:MAG: SufE family protein [Lachnospiraceae bacterium]|nr:SufE family protein [Lachnospiraceae bacterium]